MDYGFGLAVIDETLTTNTSPRERGLYVDGAWSAGCVDCPSVVDKDPDSSSWIYRVKVNSNYSLLVIILNIWHT